MISKKTLIRRDSCVDDEDKTMTKVYLLSAKVMPNFGSYDFSPISVTAVWDLLQQGYTSAVGHESTATAISTVLASYAGIDYADGKGVPVPISRNAITMEIGDRAIIFSVKDRLPEGKIATIEELNQIGWEFGLSERIDLVKMQDECCHAGTRH